MLRELGERVESAVLEGVGRTASRYQERKPLPVDLLESDDAFLAVFDASGATAEDVDVHFDENVLAITIERFRDYYDDFEMKLPGRGVSLRGEVELPAGAVVDAREATASVTNYGVLQVRLPKTEDHRGRHSDEPIQLDTDANDDSEASADASDESAADASDADTGTDIEAEPAEDDGTDATADEHEDDE